MLDLTKGYYQLQLDEESREITAFTMPKGLFQWKVLLMGMKTSGAIFQRLMDKLLGQLQPRCIRVYIYDITIYSRTYKQHLVDLDQVFEKLHRANLKINMEKCQFVKTEVILLGHLINSAGIRPNPEKIKSIQKLPAPRDVTKVKRFLEVIIFYRKFIPECASISETFTQLTRGKQEVKRKFKWGLAQEESFSLLKEKLTQAPVLNFPV